MPKNTGMGGNKRKKGKKQVQEDRELVYKGESEEYAQVTKLLGDGRFECNCADGQKRIAHVRGKMRKRIWIGNGDIILVSLRDFEPEKCDVVEKYKEKEVAKLKKVGEIPEFMVLPSSSEAEEKEVKDDYGDIIFEDQDNNNKKKDENIYNNNEEEEEKKDSDEEKNQNNEDENEDEKEEEKVEKKVEEKEEEKPKKNKREKKEKEKKIKKKRDDKKKEADDDSNFNIDDI